MRILMLGNSFTFANNLPDLLAKLTGAEVIEHTRGGARLAEHLNSSTKMGAKTQAALTGKNWDYVILQEMSNGPITSTEKYLKNAALLCKQIREAGAEPVIYATWAYERNGKQLASFGMDYDEMASRMMESCRLAAEQNYCLLAEVGKKFYELADMEPLYAEDGCHPNKRGTEIAAEVLSEVILKDWETTGKRNNCIKFFDSVDHAVKSVYGPDTNIISRIPLSGGDINAAFALYLSGGKRVFVKENTSDKQDMFEAEAAGLAALRATETIGVPSVLALGNDPDRKMSFLMLEYLEEGIKEDDYWEVFGRQLAQMHKAETKGFLPKEAAGAKYGFLRDNYIGSKPQINTPKKCWIDFYRECRLEPQIRMAEEYLEGTPIRKLIRILDRLEELLREPEQPSLLHGDLWSGNKVCGPNGRAWIIDPATYVGDFEADLAMTELFGGYPEAFYAAYAQENYIEPEYDDRRDLYHLYHMLNHLNLFGEAYLEDVRTITERY